MAEIISFNEFASSLSQIRFSEEDNEALDFLLDEVYGGDTQKLDEDLARVCSAAQKWGGRCYFMLRDFIGREMDKAVKALPAQFQ